MYKQVSNSVPFEYNVDKYYLHIIGLHGETKSLVIFFPIHIPYLKSIHTLFVLHCNSYLGSCLLYKRRQKSIIIIIIYWVAISSTCVQGTDKGLAQLCRINDFTRLVIGCTGVRFHRPRSQLLSLTGAFVPIPEYKQYIL